MLVVADQPAMVQPYPKVKLWPAKAVIRRLAAVRNVCKTMPPVIKNLMEAGAPAHVAIPARLGQLRLLQRSSAHPIPDASRLVTVLRAVSATSYQVHALVVIPQYLARR